MKVAFAGTPEFAATALRAILAAGHEVPLVLTQPDRPAGRGMKLQPSPVKQLALEHGIPVAQPQRLRSEVERAALVSAMPDVLVVAAYGIILPQPVLDLPQYGCLNIHASLLPRWRGAAPIHRAIEADDRETGITIMQMDAGLDTGAMLLRKPIAIHPDDTTGSLHDRLAVLGGELIVEALARLPGGLDATPQPPQGVTYAHKIGKAEARLDWRRSATELACAVRAFNPFPGAQALFDQNAVKIWHAFATTGQGEPGEILACDETGVTIACGDGALKCTELQRPGGRRLDARQFVQAGGLIPGMRAESAP
ncbi:MAG: methionyl-tRNA formyltransferase [Rhodocyclaceae bacterium]|nr:methionyl-tRNA formyltransferase [Rhodocyclaceae bacterium]